jgi:type I restriction enzyme S subunit
VIGNVRSKSIEFAGCRFVPLDYYEALEEIRRPQKGDVLYTLVGSFGIPVPVRDDRSFCVQRHIGILRPSRFVHAEYLAFALESSWVFEQAANCATGIAQKTVPLSGLRRLTVSVPPLDEQSRIVAKVKELTALCDRLEASLLRGDTTRSRLLEALLADALAPAPEFHITH